MQEQPIRAFFVDLLLTPVRRPRPALALLFLFVLCIAPAALVPQAGIALAQSGFDVDPNDQAGDRSLHVNGEQSETHGPAMRIDRDAETGDRIMHVAPRPEARQNPDVLIGPLLISPEITMPGPRKPHKRQ